MSKPEFIFWARAEAAGQIVVPPAAKGDILPSIGGEKLARVLI